jgi:transcriptional regulator with XRE-family HTH domain
MNTTFKPSEEAQNFYINVAEILRVERALQDLIITDVCVPLNLTKGQYSKFENGKANFNILQFYDICKILKLDPQKIIEKAVKKTKK